MVSLCPHAPRHERHDGSRAPACRLVARTRAERSRASDRALLALAVAFALIEALASSMSLGLWVVTVVIAVPAAAVYLMWAISASYKRARAIRSSVLAAVVCLVVISPVGITNAPIQALPPGTTRVDASALHVAFLDGWLPAWFAMKQWTPLNLGIGDSPPTPENEFDSGVLGAVYGRTGLINPPDIGRTVMTHRGGDYYVADGSGTWQLQPTVSWSALGYWAFIGLLLVGLLMRARRARNRNGDA